MRLEGHSKRSMAMKQEKRHLQGFLSKCCVEMDGCANVVLRWTDVLLLCCEGRMC